MELRQATLEDVEIIVKMWVEFMEYHKNIIEKEPRLAASLEKIPDATRPFAEWTKKNILGENSKINIAEVNGEPAGYSLISIDDNVPIFKINKIGHIRDLFVRKQFRGRGISSKFRDLAYEWFKENGITQVKLNVYPQNDHAHNIYKKWGFFGFHLEMRTELE